MRNIKLIIRVLIAGWFVMLTAMPVMVLQIIWFLVNMAAYTIVGIFAWLFDISADDWLGICWESAFDCRLPESAFVPIDLWFGLVDWMIPSSDIN